MDQPNENQINNRERRRSHRARQALRGLRPLAAAEEPQMQPRHGAYPQVQVRRPPYGRGRGRLRGRGRGRGNRYRRSERNQNLLSPRNRTRRFRLRQLVARPRRQIPEDLLRSVGNMISELAEGMQRHIREAEEQVAEIFRVVRLLDAAAEDVAAANAAAVDPAPDGVQPQVPAEERVNQNQEDQQNVRQEGEYSNMDQVD